MCTNQLSTQESSEARVSTRCEFVVSGALGHVLMHACRPEEEPMMRACTMIHADVPRDWDVSDVVRHFDSRGVQLEAITVVRA